MDSVGHEPNEGVEVGCTQRGHAHDMQGKQAAVRLRVSLSAVIIAIRG